MFDMSHVDAVSLRKIMLNAQFGWNNWPYPNPHPELCINSLAEYEKESSLGNSPVLFSKAAWQGTWAADASESTWETRSEWGGYILCFGYWTEIQLMGELWVLDFLTFVSRELLRCSKWVRRRLCFKLSCSNWTRRVSQKLCVGVSLVLLMNPDGKSFQPREKMVRRQAAKVRGRPFWKSTINQSLQGDHVSQTPAPASPGATGLDDRRPLLSQPVCCQGRPAWGLSIATEEVVLLFNEL